MSLDGIPCDRPNIRRNVLTSSIHCMRRSQILLAGIKLPFRTLAISMLCNNEMHLFVSFNCFRTLTDTHTTCKYISFGIAITYNLTFLIYMCAHRPLVFFVPAHGRQEHDNAIDAECWFRKQICSSIRIESIDTVSPSTDTHLHAKLIDFRSKDTANDFWGFMDIELSDDSWFGFYSNRMTVKNDRSFHDCISNSWAYNSQ